MDPELQAQLEKIQELSEDALDTLEQTSTGEVESITDDPAGDLEAAEAYAAAVAKVREEKARRVQVAEEREAKAAEIKAKIAPEPEPELEPEIEAVDETNPDELPADPEPQPEPEQSPEAVAAAITVTETPIPVIRPTLAALKTRTPVSRPRRSPLTITAAGDVAGYSAGQRIRSIDDLGEPMAEKLDAVWGSKKQTGPMRVAKIAVDYPEARSLTASAVENTRRIEAVASPDAIRGRLAEHGGNLQALVAAGGLCAPVDVRYDLDTLGVDDRPVRNALPSFQASRGGIQFIRGPAITSLTGSDTAAGGTGVVTEQNDTDSVTKTVFNITCGATVEALVDAIYLYLGVGEFNRRFFPEQWRSFYQVGLTRHARVAESRLLQRIAAGSTAVTDGTNLGAARDLVEGYTRFAAQYRSRHRLSPTMPFTVLLPFWVQDMISADLLRQAPGDNTLAFTRSQVDAMFAAHNINVGWYLDEATSGTAQVYVDEAGGAGNPWITSVVGYMFPAGTWLYLDGGELNLGVEVRDSTLIAGNNVQAFYESFEGVARTGQQSLQVTNTVCVSGEFSAGVDFTCPGSGS